MTVYSKNSYDEHDDGRILKAARKQQYNLFPAPISFLNDELKTALGMKLKKEDEETDDVKYVSLKVPIDAADKESKLYIVKIKKYDVGTPEEFLKWRMTLVEQIKNNGYVGNYEMIMNLAQTMLDGRSLDAFVGERNAQVAKNLIRKAANKPEFSANAIYDLAIFELSIRAFDSQSGWRDAFERQREYMRRDLFMGKLNPEKFSQRLQDMKCWIISPLRRIQGWTMSP